MADQDELDVLLTSLGEEAPSLQKGRRETYLPPLPPGYKPQKSDIPPPPAYRHAQEFSERRGTGNEIPLPPKRTTGGFREPKPEPVRKGTRPIDEKERKWYRLGKEEIVIGVGVGIVTGGLGGYAVYLLL